MKCTKSIVLNLFDNVGSRVLDNSEIGTEIIQIFVSE